MQFTRLGHTGLIVSRLCLGCMSFGDAERSRHTWVVPEADSRAIIRAALESGINFFDTANEYAGGSSEEITGRALNDFARRDEIVLATKAFAPWRGAPNTGGLSRKALFQAIDDSLKRLGTDYVDLFQIHRWDYNTPIEETMEALHDIVKSGRARYIGASSMFAWQFAKAQHVAALNRWTRSLPGQPFGNLLILRIINRRVEDAVNGGCRNPAHPQHRRCLVGRGQNRQSPAILALFRLIIPGNQINTRNSHRLVKTGQKHGLARTSLTNHRQNRRFLLRTRPSAAVIQINAHSQ